MQGKQIWSNILYDNIWLMCHSCHKSDSCTVCVRLDIITKNHVGLLGLTFKRVCRACSGQILKGKVLVLSLWSSYSEPTQCVYLSVWYDCPLLHLALPALEAGLSKLNCSIRLPYPDVAQLHGVFLLLSHVYHPLRPVKAHLISVVGGSMSLQPTRLIPLGHKCLCWHYTLFKGLLKQQWLPFTVLIY